MRQTALLMMRLNAYLASCGVASRRKSDAIVLAGSVKVNGKIVLAPYMDVSGSDAVECRGVPVSPAPKVYAAMNKPRGVVCAVSDRYDRVVVDLLPEGLRRLRVFPVGRLDRDSDGLLLLTNDGAFAQSIQHPSNGVAKRYEAMLDSPISPEALARWRAGFRMKGRAVKPLSVRAMERGPEWVSVTVGEGINREVREMARLCGFRVLTLTRRAIGRLVLKNLAPGDFLELPFSSLSSRIKEGGFV
ncbi:MAG: pseudouridine synthase [Synergistaceae bacterium]|jgi:23S rRNA pseudouridine2605 synthase|nr:pseudouridine synthase [Synergistaceae bacterium]